MRDFFRKNFENLLIYHPKAVLIDYNKWPAKTAVETEFLQDQGIGWGDPSMRLCSPNAS